MARVIHFEIGADNPEKAGKFYKDAFGWEIKKWDGPIDYWLIKTGDSGEEGIDGAIMKRMSPEMTTVNTIGVDSLETAMEAVTSGGGKVITKKMSVPGVGYFCYCRDTEGNTFGLMQEDESAK